MKRLIILLLATAVMVFFAVRLPEGAAASLPRADISRLSYVLYTESVSASGEISGGESLDSVAVLPLLIKSVAAEAGDTVSEGEPIIYIDREKTCAAMMSGGAVSADMAAVGGISSYSGLIGMVPEYIAAERGGVLEAIHVSAGDFVAAGEPLFTLSGGEGVIVSADIPEEDIPFIQIGQPAEITGASFPDKVYYGEVSAISSAAVKKYSGSILRTVIPVSISVFSADDSLRSGCSADAKILVSEEMSAAVVPYRALFADECGDYLYTYSEGTAVKRYVTLGRELPDGAEILSGVDGADVILVPESEPVAGGYVNILGGE